MYCLMLVGAVPRTSMPSVADGQISPFTSRSAWQAQACACAGCRHAIKLAEQAAAAGELGPAAKDLRVIYAQTDSLFAHAPHATPSQVLRALCLHA